MGRLHIISSLVRLWRRQANLMWCYLVPGSVDPAGSGGLAGRGDPAGCGDLPGVGSSSASCNSAWRDVEGISTVSEE